MSFLVTRFSAICTLLLRMQTFRCIEAFNALPGRLGDIQC
jgi:hypothetical protein